ncbi:MAG: HEAT repeat domain-containing protein [Chloroflexota bacterium]
MTRTKRRGLLRNAAIALGNSGDVDSVPILREALLDHEPLVRGHCAWALGQIGGIEAKHALSDALAGETDSSVREELLAALSDLQSRAAYVPPQSDEDSGPPAPRESGAQ